MAIPSLVPSNLCVFQLARVTQLVQVAVDKAQSSRTVLSSITLMNICIVTSAAVGVSRVAVGLDSCIVRTALLSDGTSIKLNRCQYSTICWTSRRQVCSTYTLCFACAHIEGRSGSEARVAHENSRFDVIRCDAAYIAKSIVKNLSSLQAN